MLVEVDHKEHESGSAEDESISMLEEPVSTSSSAASLPTSTLSPSLSSSALSALVREKVRKKVLANIHKKISFNCVETGLFTVKRHDEFTRWSYESGAYNNNNNNNNDNNNDENNLLPLRKVASEPNLKGRGLHKHRVRFKPYDENPLTSLQGYAQCNRSSVDGHHGNGSTEGKEVTSPANKILVEKSVFPRGARAIPLLFQSPSLPNINLDSSLEDYSCDSGSPNFKVPPPIQPGHPRYLYMLKTQYSTNHHFLHRVLLHHGHDPKEIDLFHQRYLLKSQRRLLSDEERVKQLLESQNKLYIRLVELFSLSTPDMSKSLSKLSNGMEAT